MTETMMLLTAMSGLNTLLALSVQAAFLVVTLTVVQRQRPDAVPLLATAAGIELLTTVVGVIAPFFLARLAGATVYGQVSVAWNVVLSVAHTIARILIIFAVIRLCRPDPEQI